MPFSDGTRMFYCHQLWSITSLVHTSHTWNCTCLTTLPCFISSTSMRNATDYFVHDVIRSIRQGFTVLSLLLSIPSIAMVALCMNRSSRSYSINIILTIVWCSLSLKFTIFRQMVGVLSNVDLQLIWDPVLPMPTPCVLRSESFSTIFRRTFSGKMLRFHWRDRQHCITYWHILPRYFDVKPFQGFWLSITSLNMPTFTACFIDRHQVSITATFTANKFHSGSVIARLKMVALRIHSACNWDNSCYHCCRCRISITGELLSRMNMPIVNM